jgi:sugar phosphate isomerase/epimerase
LGVELAANCPEAAAEEMRSLVNELPEGLMGVDFSPADLIRHGHKPREVVAVLGPRIVHMYANDAVRGFGSEAAIDVELGRGSADVPELLAALQEFGYRRWITVERRGSPQPVEDCRDAVQFLRSL